MSRCSCCGAAEGCMFTPDSQSLRIRNLAPTPEQSRERMTKKAETQEKNRVAARERSKVLNQDNLPLREMQTLFRFNEGAGFALGYGEEKRASNMVERGWLKCSLVIFKSRYDRFGKEVIEHRNKYSITEEGKKALKDHEKRGSRA